MSTTANDNSDNNDEIDQEALNAFQNAPWKDLNRDPRLPMMTFLFNVVKVTPKYANKEPKKLGFGLQLEVVQPAEFVGRHHTENIWIGTDADPLAQKASTWDASASYGARTQADLLTLTGVDTILDLVGKQFCASVLYNDTFVNLINFAAAGSVTPGLPVEPRKFTRKRTSTTPINSPAQATGPIACSMCGVEFPMSALAGHMSTCTVNNNL